MRHGGKALMDEAPRIFVSSKKEPKILVRSQNILLLFYNVRLVEGLVSQGKIQFKFLQRQANPRLSIRRWSDCFQEHDPA